MCSRAHLEVGGLLVQYSFAHRMHRDWIPGRPQVHCESDSCAACMQQYVKRRTFEYPSHCLFVENSDHRAVLRGPPVALCQRSTRRSMSW